MAIIDIESRCGTWPLDTQACTDWDDLSAVTGRAVEVAVHNLWALTGRRFGTCQTVLRPCCKGDDTFISTYNSGRNFPPGAIPGLIGTSTTIFAIDGTQSNILSCDDCFSPSCAELTLPFANLVSVDDVTIEGTPVVTGAGESTFAIFDHDTIIWQHPTEDKKFPNYQDLTRPLGEDKTWSITVTHGIPTPDDTATILGLYACELAKSMTNLKCDLPKTIQSMSRQGIQYQFVNEDYLMQGLVGHPLVDQWIVRVNPYRLQQRSTVWSPETIRHRTRRRTG